MTNGPGVTGTPQWRVTSQMETTAFVANGRAEQGWRVTFTTGDGTQGSVFLPLAEYTPDNVAAAITAQAAVLDAVSNLTHES